MSLQFPETVSELHAHYQGQMYALALDISCLAGTHLKDREKSIKILRACIDVLEQKIRALDHGLSQPDAPTSPVHS